MRTIYVMQGIVDHDFTEILTAYSAETEAEAYLRTCEEYDKLEPMGDFGWNITDYPRYDAWRDAFNDWAKNHPAGENGKYFDYYEIKGVTLE